MYLALTPLMRAPSVNMVAVTILVASTAANVGSLFGVHDTLYGVMFVGAWMLPISRLTLRTRSNGAGRAGDAQPRPTRTWFVMLGALPWFVAPWAHSAYPSSVLWQSLEVPVLLRWIGVALTVGMFCDPFFQRMFRAGTASPTADNDSISMRSYGAVATALVLLSANLFIAIVAAVGMGCLLVTRRGAAAQRQPERRDLHLALPRFPAVPELLETYDAAICSTGRG
jgi:hypothetical protein